MNKKHLISTFQVLGLNEKHLEVYLQLYLEKINLTKMAKILQVSRTHLYKLLSELELESLVFKSDNNRIYKAVEPLNILEILRIRELKIKQLELDVKSEIESLVKKPKLPKQIVSSNMGEQAFLESAENILNSGVDEIWCFGSSEHIQNFPEISSWFTQERRKKGILSHGLMFENRILRERARGNKPSPLKWLPTEFNAPQCFIVYGDNLTIWDIPTKTVITLNQANYANFFKLIFKMYWEKLSR